MRLGPTVPAHHRPIFVFTSIPLNPSLRFKTTGASVVADDGFKLPRPADEDPMRKRQKSRRAVGPRRTRLKRLESEIATKKAGYAEMRKNAAEESRDRGRGGGDAA